MVMSIMLTAPAAFADGYEPGSPKGPSLQIDDLDVGFWAVGAWQENARLVLTNTGTVAINVTDGDIEDLDKAFTLHNVSYPFTIAMGATHEIEVSFSGNTAGAFDAVYGAIWGAKGLTIGKLHVEAYTAAVGDVVENPFSVIFASGTYTNSVTVADMKSNYNTPVAASAKDVVYKFTVAADSKLDVSSTNNAVEFTLYAENFNMMQGPMANNALKSFGNAVTDYPIFNGTYYLVASCDTDFDATIAVGTMPIPAIAFDPTPTDLETGVPANLPKLTWKVGQYAEEYRLLFGTQVPPTTVAQDWTTVATEFALANELDPNTQYFWKVELRNNGGAPATADMWHFTTAISVPANFTAVVADTNDVTLAWDALSSKAFKGYNVYRDGVKINTALLTVNTYADMDLAFNMAPGYTYNVTAVYDEGESVYSTAVVIKIDGIGFVKGQVTQLLAPNDPIAGATVTLTNANGGDNYVFTTDATGKYEGEVYQATYNYEVAATNYVTASLSGVVVDYNLTVTKDFQLDEFPYPCTSVTATEQNENEVLVEWVFAPTKDVLKFNIYRAECGGANRVFLGEVINGSQFLDQTWGAITGFGTFEWIVEVVYSNATAPKSSNCLDKNMEAVVDVKVTTNTANQPGPDGTVVAFENTADANYNFDITLDATGLGQIPAVRKGSYTYTVTLASFEVITGSADILADKLFEWELIEITDAPSLLYVTPVGMATWIDPNALVDFDFLPLEKFDGNALPANWTMSTQNPVGWQVSDNPPNLYWGIPAGDGSFAWNNDDALGSGVSTNDTMFSPSISLGSAAQAMLEFSAYYSGSYGHKANVTISVNGGAFVLLKDFTSQYSWQVIQVDLGAYLGNTIVLGFVSYDQGGWASGVAIDNVKVYGKAVSTAKEFLSYRVWLDGVKSADVNQAMYQYGDNAEVLVAGVTYTSEVANEYSTGFSSKIAYDFKYQPCTAFDGTANLAAVYQGGTANNLVSWDAVADQTIDGVAYQAMGTNVYRDGTLAMFVAAGTTSYLDANLAPGTYEYCTQVVYSLDAGNHTWESCATTCVSGVVVPADIFGSVAGFVYNAIDNSPIASATVAIANANNSYTLTTDATGAYTSDVVIEGTYEYTVNAAGYVAQTKAGVVVAFGTTATEDFHMIETAYPVGNVHAQEIDANTVKVTWGDVPAEGWLAYDDGNMAFGGIGGPGGNYSISYAVKFTPDMLEDYLASGYITSISLAQIDIDPAGNVADPLLNELRIYQGANADVLIYTEDITSALLMGETTVVALAQAVSFDASQDLWITMYSERVDGSYNEPLSAATSFVSGTSDLFAINGADWTSVEAEFGAAGYAFMLRAYANTDAGSKSVALGTVEIPEGKYKDFTGFSSKSTGLKGKVEPQKVYTAENMNSKSLLGYNIYRMPCTVDAVATEYFIGYTLDPASFTDNSWGAVSWGMYKWAVEAVYTNDNLAPAAFSVECLDKDMDTKVNMTVTTNSGDSPAGTSVVFKNKIETALDDITTTIPGSGLKTIDPFRKGTYDITVSKIGFVTQEYTDVVIHDETDFTWEMIEDMIAPMDLYVTSTGYATWTLSGGDFTPFSEDFEGGSLPDGWEMTTNSAQGWFFTTDGSSAFWTIPTGDGTYACSNDDGANDEGSVDYLITPELDFSYLAAGQLAFSAYYNGAYGEIATVEMSISGGDWIVLKTLDAADAWQDVVVDLTDYAGNAGVKIAFHANDGGGWASGFAVDNVTIGVGAKSVEDYMVWHDGAYSTSTTEQFYQYGTNETLVSGNTYVAEVAAVYTTGQSDKASYTWTYMSCDELPAWTSIEGENVMDTDEVLVKWSMFQGSGGGPGEEFFEDFEAGTTPTGWVVLDEDGDSYSWDNSAVDDFGFDAYSGDYCMTSASYINAVGALTPDNWLISPAIQIGGSSVLSFMIDAQDPNYADEQYYVLVSTTGTAVADFTQIHSAVSPADWAEVVLDLSAYAGETVHIAFRHADVTDMFYIKLDDFKVSNSDTKAAYTAPVAHTASAGMPFRTSNMDASQIEAAFAAYTAANNAKADVTVLGSNLYRDGVMVAFIAMPDTFYVDMDMDPGYYDYCVEKVYSDDGGVHTFVCGDMTCVEDVLVQEECNAPEDLIAEDLLGDGYTATLSWGGSQAEVEFRHDDGISIGQLGSGSGTTNTVLGNTHTVDAELSEISWYLTAEGGPHATVTVYVMGLDANGVPDGNNVLFASELSNTDDMWNTYTLDNPIVADGGFFLGVAYNGFVAIGTDDGVGDPYVFQNNTHFFTGDYTAGGWETWETYNFSVNAMIRAMGVEGAANSYDYVAPTAEGTSDLEYIASVEPVVTSATETRGFTGYNVYRDGAQIATGVQDETYQDVFDQAGEHCYTVTASFEFCEESAHSNEACVYVGVGINDVENNISIYPNPATDFVMVEASSTIRSIKVTNYMGQVVHSNNTVENTQQRIETSSLSAGVYFVEVETVAGIETVRIVISK